MTAWVVRAGSEGEHEQWNLAHQVATVGWSEVPDMSACETREDVRALVEAAYPGLTPGALANRTGQLWAFRSRIHNGDVVVMPLKTRRGYLAVGRCDGEYRYEAGSGDGNPRHSLPVRWNEEHVAKTSIKDDLLFSLGGIMTVFNPSRNNGDQRLEHVLQHGVDPGSNTGAASKPALIQQKGNGAATLEDDVHDPETRPTPELIRDRVRTHLVENFAGHKLTRLVADILEALGFVCEVSPAGPDGGVDILAGSGPLGLDQPTLIVEVKSEPTPVGSQVVRGLHSAMTQHDAAQGLLVAWGGVTAQARREFLTQRTRLRIWDAEDVLENLFERYADLPESTRSAIPLRQVWVLDDEEV